MLEVLYILDAQMILLQWYVFYLNSIIIDVHVCYFVWFSYCFPDGLFCGCDPSKPITGPFVRGYSIQYRGRIQRGAHPARAPPKIWKNMIFWRKIVIFHTKYPKIFAPPSAIGKKKIFWCKIVIFHTKYPKKLCASLRSAQFI